MNADNSYGCGFHPLPPRLAGLGRFCEALKPANLISHKAFPNDSVHMLTVRADRLSIMARDMESLLGLGLQRVQSNEPGELSFYFGPVAQ